jgi:flagellum-specific ATP synthase
MQGITDYLISDLEQLHPVRHYGTVTAVNGMLVEISGCQHKLAVGDRCLILNKYFQEIPVEVVGFKAGKALAMPYGSLEGVGLDNQVLVQAAQSLIYPHNSWLGRVVNAFAEPVDGKGSQLQGKTPCFIKAAPPLAHTRTRIGGKLDVGVRAINTFLTTCKGQRMGIFSGSGVGKSTLLSMLAKYTNADVNVIGLVGERGREVQEFIQDDLGEDGLRKSVLVVATSDESPLMRRQAAYMTLCVAEYFRNQGKDVLCLMDSVTRFAMAQREIGLSAGEPPTTKGYTPTVFAELPRLLERAGPGQAGQGTITGLFTVLVEGDDTNEPIADAVRGIIDGHILLDRKIGERGRYPAINLLRSISRALPDCNSAEENLLLKRARQLLAQYSDMEELIRLGAYKKGSDPQTDEAIAYYPQLDGFLSQEINQKITLAEGYNDLRKILEGT